MARTSALRASDADRDAIAERLHRAAVEGRLEADELEERLHAALRARTYGDLKRLVADLPAPVRTPAGRTAFAVALRAAVALAAVVAVVAAVAVAVAVFAFLAAWWFVWVVVWLVLRSRHGCRGAHGWHPARARRI